MTSGVRRPDSDCMLALKLRDDGWIYRQIGEHFGICASAAYYLVARGARLRKAASLTFPSRSFLSWDDQGMGHRTAQLGEFNWLGERRKKRDPYGSGDLAWQWRDWNEWVATPMIGRHDDNTIWAPPYG